VSARLRNPLRIASVALGLPVAPAHLPRTWL
jgi:hypothetical protein